MLWSWTESTTKIGQREREIGQSVKESLCSQFKTISKRERERERERVEKIFLTN